MSDMKNTIDSQDQVYWYLGRPSVPPLRQSLEADVVIVGGGMAGLSAAQAFLAKNKRVVLLEAYYCGAGASGKSSGFITPNSEISLSTFIERHGQEGGKTIWNTIESGLEHIRKNIISYKLSCDYQAEDSLYVANSPHTTKAISEEYESLKQLGYKTEYISKEKLPDYLGSDDYYAGVIYPNTFGINAYKYCQEMKNILMQQGAQIYEETPVLSIEAHQVTTHHARVKAEYVIVCTDRFTPNLNVLTKDIYHAQNFLLISQTLSDAELKTLFPDKKYMVWDTDLLYSYFRVAENRLLLGGGSLWHMYDKREKYHNRWVHRKLTNYFKRKFPQLDLQFEQYWPGMIGLSKDIAPLCGRDKDHASIYYVAATAGLPVAAALGNYCADHLIDGRDDLKDYFSPYRKFPIGKGLQTILGMKLTFALSHLIEEKL